MTRVARQLTPAERRALLRRHHPDLGGDPEEFVRVMAAINALGVTPAPDVAPSTAATAADSTAGRPGPGTTTTSSPSREGTTTLTPNWRRRGRRALRQLRATLPRRVPGARRYGQL